MPRCVIALSKHSQANELKRTQFRTLSLPFAHVAACASLCEAVQRVGLCKTSHHVANRATTRRTSRRASGTNRPSGFGASLPKETEDAGGNATSGFIQFIFYRNLSKSIILRDLRSQIAVGLRSAFFDRTFPFHTQLSQKMSHPPPSPELTKPPTLTILQRLWLFLAFILGILWTATFQGCPF